MDYKVGKMVVLNPEEKYTRYRNPTLEDIILENNLVGVIVPRANWKHRIDEKNLVYLDFKIYNQKFWKKYEKEVSKYIARSRPLTNYTVNKLEIKPYQNKIKKL